jgi:hypothetical protein
LPPLAYCQVETAGPSLYRLEIIRPLAHAQRPHGDHLSQLLTAGGLDEHKVARPQVPAVSRIKVVDLARGLETHARHPDLRLSGLGLGI